MKSEKQGQSAIEPPTGDRAPAGEGRSRAGGDKRGRSRAGNGQRGTSGVEVYRPEDLVSALLELEAGNFSARLPENGAPLDIRTAQAFNRVAARNEAMANELGRISRTVGREGRSTDRADLPGAHGDWGRAIGAVNAMITDLVQPTQEVARTLTAVAQGDLSQKMSLEVDGKRVQGEFLRIATTVNRMVDQLSSFAAEVTRVAREVGTEGRLGGQAEVPN